MLFVSSFRLPITYSAVNLLTLYRVARQLTTSTSCELPSFPLRLRNKHVEAGLGVLVIALDSRGTAAVRFSRAVFKTRV